MNESKIFGIMIKHSNDDFEYYMPKLSEEDQNRIYEILDKYGDNNESLRGELVVIDKS